MTHLDVDLSISTLELPTLDTAVFVFQVGAGTEWASGVKWSLSMHGGKRPCVHLSCSVILSRFRLWNSSFSLCLFVPIWFPSVSLLLQAFACRTAVCLPFPLFFIFYQCHFSLFLMSCLWNTSPILLRFRSAQILPVMPFSRNLHCFASCLHLLFLIN